MNNVSAHCNIKNDVSQYRPVCYHFTNEVVFFMQERLKALTNIVWPEIALLVKNTISRAREEGTV